MSRPYIICHMTTSIDGKVTGDFLFRDECAKATEIYYEINRKLKCDGFICGRVTMEESFTQKWYPDLEDFESINDRDDFIPNNLSGFYAVAFDTKGRLGWKSANIIDPDGDIGYDNAQISEKQNYKVYKSRPLEVLTASQLFGRNSYVVGCGFGGNMHRAEGLVPVCRCVGKYRSFLCGKYSNGRRQAV